VEAGNIRRIARGVVLFSMGAMVLLFAVAILGGEELSFGMVAVLLVWLGWAAYMVFRSRMLNG
jgi:hypothetical protein